MLQSDLQDFFSSTLLAHRRGGGAGATTVCTLQEEAALADAGSQEQSTCPLPPRPRSQQESLTGSCAESSNITQSFSVNSARLFFCTGRAFVGQPRACAQSRFRGSPTCAVSTLPGSSPQLPSRPTLFSVLFFRPYFRSSGDPGCRPAAWALKFF